MKHSPSSASTLAGTRDPRSPCSVAIRHISVMNFFFSYKRLWSDQSPRGDRTLTLNGAIYTGVSAPLSRLHSRKDGFQPRSRDFIGLHGVPSLVGVPYQGV